MGKAWGWGVAQLEGAVAEREQQLQRDEGRAEREAGFGRDEKEGGLRNGQEGLVLAG